jgi:predicted deacylase
MHRVTTELPVNPYSIGTASTVVIHDYYPSKEVQSMDMNSLEWFQMDRAYIQASLHAEELPGLLVVHHLTKLLDRAAEMGKIIKQITLVPFANPIGLTQFVMGTHFGVHSFRSSINFNRNWLDATPKVMGKVENQLSKEDAKLNTAILRKAMMEVADESISNSAEVTWKRNLFQKAASASVVLDLHCDLGNQNNSFFILE